MAVDPLSPIAPARIRALLLPVGRIKRSRFIAFVDLLQQESLVRLGDISPDPRPDRNMFSPLAWPDGTLLYDLSSSMPSASHLSLSPFEQFREPLMVIGIGDASEYAWLQPSRGTDGSPSTTFEEPPAGDDEANTIQFGIDDLREQFPRAYLHSIMLFDSATQSRHPRLPQETLLIPPRSQLKTTTMKTFMCDLTATLLAEMTTLAKSIQALPTLVSPASQNGTTELTPSWAASDSTSQFSRRNSQTPGGSRPESPVGNALKEGHRMSMPVLPSSSGGALSTEDPRTASLSAQGTRTPPTTFDEISGINAANTLHQTNSNPARPTSATKAADRVSITGFGSGGVGERARNKGRGRIGIVIGTLYMCAGQWVEAVRELTEGATRARALSDHLWHAKALEHIMVCMLLFAWSGMEFQIPPICYPTSDKSGGNKSPTHTPSSSVSDVSTPAKPHKHDNSLDALNSLLPDMVNMILNLYTRAANFAGESLPPLAFSECVIRFSKLLAAINLSGGFLDEDALRQLVQNTPYKQKPRLSVPRLSVHPTRNDIASMLFRALPGPVESSGMNPTDRVVVLAGVASILSSLGLQRKKAIVMKEFITSLVPGLIQARKVGAAEMGVHPAAGLAALNIASGGSSGSGALNLGEGEVENGIEEFLGLLGRIYGIPNSKGNMPNIGMPSQRDENAESASDSIASQRVVDTILAISSLRSFGSLSLKLEILRTCLSFCEALPDFNGVLHFTALLLRVAGPGTAPRPNSTDVFVSLPRDEQIRLYSNISRTVTAAKKLGLKRIETEYWDDFLVRGLFILEEIEPLRLTQRQGTELKSDSQGKDGPFLHNAWLRKPQTNAANTVLVANEHYRFVIAMQNPYEFELGVESLKIAAEGVEFVALEEHFLLGPYRTQKFQITGTAQTSGSLKIIGCYVKLIGCRERLFPIFPEPWKPKREAKMKRMGLKACLGAPTSRPSSAIAPSIDSRATFQPKPESLTFSVIPDQPVIIITNVSLPQSAVMVLEGERKRFTVTVKNTSSETTVDFVHISFQDTATAAIQAATSNKDLPAAELHELEVQLAHHPSLRWCKNEAEESPSIKPGAEAQFTIEVIGRTRLTDATIQIDYANLGKRRSEVEEHFFTRQVSAPISITVNASVQLQRPDIVPLSGDIAWSSDAASGSRIQSDDEASQSRSSGKADGHLRSFISQKQSDDTDEEYCMLLLDLRNSWPNPLSISLQARKPMADGNYANDSWNEAHSVNEVIQPGHVSRVVMILPKIYLKAPHAAVPSLNPANQRQFVVSTSKISPEIERASREAFWYREELLKIVRGTWTEDGNGRHGELELRSIRFTPRMVEAIKLDDLAIKTTIISDNPVADGEEIVRQVGRAKFEVPIDDFLTMKTFVRNRSPRPISPILRLQPHVAGLPHNVALDLDKRFSWTGVLQRKLPVIQPGETVESELGIVALCGGTYEVGATVDEAEFIKMSGGDDDEKTNDDQMLLQGGNVLGEPKLRTWYMTEPCTIVTKR
ncbi:TRAPP II complex [Alternaria rosae]|uniref:TRAPP II complex n=1 Tax=Alternaria rosae TaxID=1187941 RepID=UPI001E8E7B10|nr:TRAPP II complex [Alternaria rosae]KAH6868145.1 TRAPP II complex [Alternaria rosae]